MTRSIEFICSRKNADSCRRSPPRCTRTGCCRSGYGPPASSDSYHSIPSVTRSSKPRTGFSLGTCARSDRPARRGEPKDQGPQPARLLPPRHQVPRLRILFIHESQLKLTGTLRTRPRSALSKQPQPYLSGITRSRDCAARDGGISYCCVR